MQDDNRKMFMMEPTNKLKGADFRIEDAVINGLFSGVLAGLAMILVLALLGSYNQPKIKDLLGLFDPTGNQNFYAGGFAHLAVSAVYGLIFGLLWKLFFFGRRIPVWIGGVIFGGLIFVFSELFISQGSGTPLFQIPALLFGISHLVYGTILGLGFQHLFPSRATGTKQV
jgi:hypothetical protein